MNEEELYAEDAFQNSLRVFEEFNIAQQLLGTWESPFPKSWNKPSVDQSLPVAERLKKLEAEIKAWVVLKALELEEFEGDDLVRLRGEAVGAMFALRELRNHCTEIEKA